MNCKYCNAICSSHGLNIKKEFCKGFSEMTNADYIRSRSNKGLAVVLEEIVSREIDRYESHGTKMKCVKDWEEWLSTGVSEKSESEDSKLNGLGKEL